MRMSSTFAAMVVVCAIWTGPVASAAAVGSDQEARTAAAQFAQALDWPYGAPSGARLDGVGGHGELWLVDFSGAARVSVDPATGQIVNATDASRQAALDSGPDPGEAAINEEQARHTADRVLEVVGLPSDYQFLRSMKGGASGDNKEWVFSWVRVFHGIPYDRDITAVRIAATDGGLLGFGRSSESAPPPDLPVAVPEDDALAFATEVASYLGLTKDSVKTTTVELRVVQPNSYWGPGPVSEELEPGAASRIARVVTINRTARFWVDAADGSLLGGAQTTGIGFIKKRLSKKLSWTGSPAARSRSITWPLAGLALPLAALVFFLMRRSARARVRG